MSQTTDGNEASSSTRVFMAGISDGTLQALTSCQKGFISSIRILELQENITGEALKQSVAEMFPPAMLFNKELLDMPAIYSSLRDFLDSRGANLQQHSSRRIKMTLATSLYDEPEDREAVTEIVSHIFAEGRKYKVAASATQDAASTSNFPSSAPQLSSNNSSDKIAHNVAMRLKEKDKKFGGELGESWMEYVDEYLQICKDYSLSPPQKLRYLHNLLRGDAKRFYLDRVENYATQFQQAVQLVNEEYN